MKHADGDSLTLDFQFLQPKENERWGWPFPIRADLGEAHVSAHAFPGFIYVPDLDLAIQATRKQQMACFGEESADQNIVSLLLLVSMGLKPH